MKPLEIRILIALAAGVMLFGPQSASAWVAVRAVRPVGAVAVGVAAGAVTGAAVASASQPHTTVVAAPPPPPAGMVTTLPAGCVSSGGRYQCGSVWYQPYFGGNGVYYQAVAP